MTIISFTRFNLMIETGKLEERAGGYVPSELPLDVQYGIRKNEIEQIAGKRLIGGRKIAETGTCVGTVTGPIIIFPCMIAQHARITIINKEQLDKLVEVGVVTESSIAYIYMHAHKIEPRLLFKGIMYDTIAGKRLTGTLDDTGTVFESNGYLIPSWMFARNFKTLLKGAIK